MSGSRSTESREAATSPNSTTPSVVMNTVTGRRIEPSIRRMVASPRDRWSLELDGLDPRALLQAALADGDDAVALRDPTQDLGGVARDRAEADRRAHHGVGAGDEHEVLAVLVEGRAAWHHQHVAEHAGADAHAREASGAQHAVVIAHLEGHLEGPVGLVHHRV